MTLIPVEFVGGPADGLRVTVEAIHGTIFPPMFQQVAVPPGPGASYETGDELDDSGELDPSRLLARYRRSAPRPGENHWRYLYLAD